MDGAEESVAQTSPLLLLLLLQVTAVFGKDPRSYGLMTTEFIGDDDGNLRAVRTIDVELKDGSIQHIAGSEREWPTDLVLIAMG